MIRRCTVASERNASRVLTGNGIVVTRLVCVGDHDATINLYLWVCLDAFARVDQEGEPFQVLEILAAVVLVPVVAPELVADLDNRRVVLAPERFWPLPDPVDAEKSHAVITGGHQELEAGRVRPIAHEVPPKQVRERAAADVASDHEALQAVQRVAECAPPALGQVVDVPPAERDIPERPAQCRVAQEPVVGVIPPGGPRPDSPQPPALPLFGDQGRLFLAVVR